MAARKAAAKKKAPLLGFFNWKIGGIKSKRGFSILDNEYCSAEEKALIEFAKTHGGSVTVTAEITIVVHDETPKELDLSSIEIVERAA